jgi:hypothetical protein
MKGMLRGTVVGFIRGEFNIEEMVIGTLNWAF